MNDIEINNQQENKTAVRIIIELLQDSQSEFVLKNVDKFIEIEKRTLDLAYLSGQIDKTKNISDPDDYYGRTYLQPLYDFLNKSKDE